MRTGRSDVIEILLTLESEHATGVLDFRAEGVLTRIFVERGVPVFAEAGVLGETLGNVLVREKVLTADQFAAVVRRMTQTLVEGNEQARIGEIIVELGLLEKRELDTALAAQVEKKLIGCVHRGSGTWSFERDSAAVAAVTHYPTPIRAVLLDACELWAEERTSQLIARNRFPQLTMNLQKVADDFGLDEREAAIAKTLDGTRPASSVNEPVLLCALLAGRAMDLVEKATDDPFKSDEPVTATGRRRAFRSKMSSRDDVAIEHLVREREQPLPEAKNERESQIFAEDDFQTGKRFLALGNFEAALPKFRKAAERTNAPLYRLYEHLVESRIRGSFANAAATKNMAIQIAKEDPENAFAHYVLGFVALEEQQGVAARRFFAHAFKLDAELVDAGRQARLLEMRKDTPAAIVRPAPTAPVKEAPARKSRVGVVLVMLLLLVVLLASAAYYFFFFVKRR